MYASVLVCIIYINYAAIEVNDAAKCAKTSVRKPVAGFLTINATNITDCLALDTGPG